LKFIVDDVWKCSKDLPVSKEEDGTSVNSIMVMDESGTAIGGNSRIV
jgi:hypothetical protein